MAGDRFPPQLESPHPPVSGDLPTANHLPVTTLPVPVNNPLTKPSTLSGPKGSAPWGIFLYSIYAPSPTPDNKFS